MLFPKELIMVKTVIALYDEMEDATDVIQDLVDEGFDRANISLTAYDPEGRYARYLDVEGVEVEEDVDMQDAVGFGAVVGTLGGLVVGLAAIGIPGVGPAITAGTIGATLLSAGVGAAAGGLIGALVEAGIPDEEAEMYAEGVRRGGTLIVVETTEARAEEAAELMEDYDPVDVEERAETWQEQGWEGYDEEAEPYTEEQITRERESYPEHDEFEDEAVVDYDEDYADVEEDYAENEEEAYLYEGLRVRVYDRT
jgi:hypothetical protein